MALIIRLFFLSLLVISVSACNPAYRISDNELRLAKSGKLDKTGNAVVVAGGRFYARNLFGAGNGPLSGHFYRAPQKPDPGQLLPTILINSNYFAKDLHKVSLIPAGTWVMHNWIGSFGNAKYYSKKHKHNGWARFTVKPGEVVYIGELVIRTYHDSSAPKGPLSVRNNMEEARRALANEYPKLAKKLIYRPMAVTP